MENKTFFTLTAIKEANKAGGHHWFSKESIRFFASRFCRKVFPSSKGGAYFVTSEACRWDNSPRLYSVRYASPDGSIDTVGEFQAYKTRQAAMSAAKKIAASE